MFLTIIHIALVIVLIILILLQSPSSDGLSSFSNAHQNINSFVVKRSPSTFMNKLTAIVAASFIISTLILVGINAKEFHKKSLANKIILDAKITKEEGKDLNINVPLNN